MPDPRGFIKVPRATPPERDPAERVARLRRDLQGPARARAEAPGEPLHGLRRAVLQPRLPARQPDPRLERPRPHRAAGARRSTSSTPPTTSPSSPASICPAPCESACVLDINDEPVTIKQIEYAIIERALEEGWVKPDVPETRTGQHGRGDRRGPGGPRRRAGAERRSATRSRSIERDEAPGGLIRFGVPDAKLEKWIIDRRVEGPRRGGHPLLLRRRRRRRGAAGGRAARPPRRRGRSPPGSRVPRELEVPGRGARRRPHGDGLPLHPQPLRRLDHRGRRARARARGADRRQGQGRGRDRRRRHRHGLHLQRQPRGREVGDPPRRLSRDPGRAAATTTRHGRCR